MRPTLPAPERRAITPPAPPAVPPGQSEAPPLEAPAIAAEIRAWLESLPASALMGVVTLSVIILALFVVAWYRIRSSRRRRVAAQARATALSTRPRAPETITPEEIVGTSDRADILDKRIDEEVRARMHLEERLSQLHEEVKVMRSRLHRIERRGEAGS